MAPKGNVTTRLNPLRLNTINHLRVRRPNQHEQNACVTVMSSMLSMCLCEPPKSSWPERSTIGRGQSCEAHDSQNSFRMLCNRPVTDLIVLQIDCWASQGYGHEGCAALEAQLRKCMDAPVRSSLLIFLHRPRVSDSCSLAIYRNRKRRRRTPSTTT